MIPRVSFVVPCYKHGHFLLDCVRSILGQSYEDLEIVIMDDCSPDDTPAIARALNDRRVRYVRNERNLGHLANYNKGIGLTRGEFIWLINVDDYLRSPDVLMRFVAALDAHPTAAYVFCPAVAVRNGVEEAPHGSHGGVDRLISGNAFVAQLVARNTVPTPAVMVRRSSYDRVGVFPADMPHAGDWFQWCRHALHGDVAYVAEPMVCYRRHDANMSTFYLENPVALVADEMRVRFRVKALAEELGRKEIARAALEGIAADYTARVTLGLFEGWRRGLTYEQFEMSLWEQCLDPHDVSWITATVLAGLGDAYYARREREAARTCYQRALRYTPFAGSSFAKLALMRAGVAGDWVRRSRASASTPATN